MALPAALSSLLLASRAGSALVPSSQLDLENCCYGEERRCATDPGACRDLLALHCPGHPLELSTTTTTTHWFCSHDMPWEECQKYLPSESWALQGFMSALEAGNEPPARAFQGRGIVMSGGPHQLLQALANLHILRHALGSELPVEFWHAFELLDSHCEALAKYGAKCRTLRSPGVYPHWQTTTPAILSSDFQEVLWIDTDITPLLKPERLFETEAFRRDGALFWPDLWGAECAVWGQTAWEGHVARHLLDVDYNRSEPQCMHEHEAGHFLIDKARHWKPLCLANYLATRYFFTRVLWGYKDVFRFAWLKLRASAWFGPLLPGLVGARLYGEKFQAVSLVHFWPSGDELGEGTAGRPVPLYIHQKKVPFSIWQDVVTFNRSLGQCVNYQLAPFVPAESGAERWHIGRTDPQLADWMSELDHIWNEVYMAAKEMLEKLDPRDEGRLHPTRDPKRNIEHRQVAKACPCDFEDNRWFLLLSLVTGGQFVSGVFVCAELLEPEADFSSCPMGHLLLALLCTTRSRDATASQALVAIAAQLLPSVEKCLDYSFFPMEHAGVKAYLQEAQETSDPERLRWSRGFDLPVERLANFPQVLRACVPLRDPTCWAVVPDVALKVHASCLHCCNPAFRSQPWRDSCFDSVYTEERCCNPA